MDGDGGPPLAWLRVCGVRKKDRNPRAGSRVPLQPHGRGPECAGTYLPRSGVSVGISEGRGRPWDGKRTHRVMTMSMGERTGAQSSLCFRQRYKEDRL